MTFNFNDFLVSKVLDPKYKSNLGVTDICLQKITWSWWWNQLITPDSWSLLFLQVIHDTKPFQIAEDYDLVVWDRFHFEGRGGFPDTRRPWVVSTTPLGSFQLVNPMVTSRHYCSMMKIPIYLNITRKINGLQKHITNSTFEKQHVGARKPISNHLFVFHL